RSRGHGGGAGANRTGGRRAKSFPGHGKDGEAWQRRGQVYRAGRRDGRSIRARLARDQIVSRAPRFFGGLSEEFKSPWLGFVGNQCVAPGAIAARRFCRVAIDKKTAKHRMVKAANFMLDKKHPAAA